jgi:NAD(P)-dependent dehydrogenase (short-subunit alcohol dehydrogenase family)
VEVDLAGRIAVVAGSETDSGRAIAEALVANGATIEAMSTHVLETPSECRNRIDDCVRRLGALHLLVNACALADVGEDAGKPGAFDRAVARTEALTTAAGNAMTSPGGGRILNLLSVLGLLPARGRPHVSIGHAALVALTRISAMNLAPRGVVVNALAIGAINGHGGDLIGNVPIGRSGRLEEVAAAALFLLDPANTYTVGHVLTVDGGWQAGYARNF